MNFSAVGHISHTNKLPKCYGLGVGVATGGDEGGDGSAERWARSAGLVPSFPEARRGAGMAAGAAKGRTAGVYPRVTGNLWLTGPTA